MQTKNNFLSTYENIRMYEYCPNECYKDKINYDKSLIVQTFIKTSLAYHPDEIKNVPEFLANLTGNEKQNLIMALNSSADFEAFSLRLIKVNVTTCSQKFMAGMTFYLQPHDTITKLKEEIRKILRYGNEEKLRIVFNGRLLNPLMIRHGNDPQEFPSKQTADSEDTVESIGMSGTCHVVLAPIL